MNRMGQWLPASHKGTLRPVVVPWLATLLSVLAAPAVANALELSAQELRGKAIYEGGASGAQQQITAVVANAPGPVPGSMVPCVACHGASGRGVADDGVSPPDIRWSYLTGPGGHRHGSGRVHPAFDEQTIARSISDGVDPGGNALEAGMPRYTMMLTDLDDLLAYMKRLEVQLDPGLTPGSIRLGTLLPIKGELAGLGSALQAVMQAYFDQVNAGGGVHGRNIELVVGEHVADPTFGAWMVRDLLREQRPFALVGAYVGGIEQLVAASADEQNIPLVGALTAMPGMAGASNRYMFYLLSGLEGQARVLARHARQVMKSERPRMVVVHPVGDPFDIAATAIREQARDADWAAVPVLSYESGKFDPAYLAAELQGKGAEGVFFLGPEQDLGRLVSVADELAWTPEIFLPGLFASDRMLDYPLRFDRHVHLAASSLPSDMDPGGAGAFARLHESGGLDYQYLDYQVQAFAAARLVVEALQRVGPALSREQLIGALEKMEGFQSGVLPPFSFSAQRRIGAMGGHLLVLDLKAREFAPSGGWVSLPPR